MRAAVWRCGAKTITLARAAARDPYADAMLDIPLSALEVAMVQTGTRAVDTLRDTTAFARGLEDLGYHRLWYAEHHHSPAIGAFPPVVLTAHAAASTSRIRLGSGGVLAPNHAPSRWRSSSARWPPCTRTGSTWASAVDPAPSTTPPRGRCVAAPTRRRTPSTGTTWPRSCRSWWTRWRWARCRSRGCWPPARRGPRSPRNSACRSRSPTTSGRTTPPRSWSAIGRPFPRPAGASGPACCCAWRPCARRRRRRPHGVRDR